MTTTFAANDTQHAGNSIVSLAEPQQLYEKVAKRCDHRLAGVGDEMVLMLLEEAQIKSTAGGSAANSAAKELLNRLQEQAVHQQHSQQRRPHAHQEHQRRLKDMTATAALRGERVFLVACLHQSENVLPHWTVELLRLLLALRQGPVNTSVSSTAGTSKSPKDTSTALENMSAPAMTMAMPNMTYTLSWWNGSWGTWINGTWGTWTLDNETWPCNGTMLLNSSICNRSIETMEQELEFETTTEMPSMPGWYYDPSAVTMAPPVPRPAEADAPPFPRTPPPPSHPPPFPNHPAPHQFPTEPPNPGWNKSFPKPHVWTPKDTTPPPSQVPTVPPEVANPGAWQHSAEADNLHYPNWTVQNINSSAYSINWTRVHPNFTNFSHAFGRLFVSVYESGSTDRTRELLSVLEAALSLLGVPHRIVYGNMSRGNRNRIEFLADIRNHAMQPLYDSDMSYDRVLWLSDNYFCADGALQLLAHALPASKGGLGADAVCGADYHMQPYCEFYDVWATTNMRGRRFRSVYPIASVHEKDYQAGRPFQVFSCWSGFLAIAADVFQKERLLFRRNVPKENECAEPETELLFYDLWRLGRGRIAMSPQAKVAYTWPNFRECAMKLQPQAFDEHPPLEFRADPPDFINCCPLGENESYVHWDNCEFGRRWDPHRRRGIPRLPPTAFQE